MADRRKDVRALLATALTDSIRDVGASRAAVARWMAVSERTVYDWAKGIRPIRVEIILASPRLGPVFHDYLCGASVEKVIAGELRATQ